MGSRLRPPVRARHWRRHVAARKIPLYIGQDYVYLKEYVRARALAVAKAPDEPSMRKMAETLNTLLNSEMLLHRRLAPILGVTTEESAQSPDPRSKARAAASPLLPHRCC